MRRGAPCRLPCPPNPGVPRSRQLSPRSHSPDPAPRRLCPAPPTTCRVPASFCPAPSPFPLPACRVPPTAPRPTATTSQGQVTSWPGNSPAPTAGCPAAAGARDKAVRRTARGTPPHPAPRGRRPSQHCSLSRTLTVQLRRGTARPRPPSRSNPHKRRGSASPLRWAATHRARLARTRGARRVHGAGGSGATKRPRGGSSKHGSGRTCVAEAASEN